MLYRVRHFVPDPHVPGWKLNRTWVVGTLRAVKLTADAAMGVRHETQYGARVNRAAFCDIERIMPRRQVRTVSGRKLPPHQCSTRPCGQLEQETTIVPSVGELGYW